MDGFCHECAHWEAVTPQPDPEYGVCNHPDRPWDTPERNERDGNYAACMGREETCPLLVLRQEAAAAAKGAALIAKTQTVGRSSKRNDLDDEEGP